MSDDETVDDPGPDAEEVDNPEPDYVTIEPRTGPIAVQPLEPIPGNETVDVKEPTVPCSEFKRVVVELERVESENEKLRAMTEGESNSVPYPRFREVVEEKNKWKHKAKKLGERIGRLQLEHRITRDRNAAWKKAVSSYPEVLDPGSSHRMRATQIYQSSKSLQANPEGEYWAVLEAAKELGIPPADPLSVETFRSDLMGGDHDRSA